MSRQVVLDFGEFELRADLFNLPVCTALIAVFPATVSLTSWGGELYGTLELAEVKKGKLVAEIPAGGIAYSYRGSFLCVFFGQTPAWPVEHIGNIEGNEWVTLKNVPIDKVLIRLA
jgi:hypothetical protein